MFLSDVVMSLLFDVSSGVDWDFLEKLVFVHVLITKSLQYYFQFRTLCSL